MTNTPTVHSAQLAELDGLERVLRALLEVLDSPVSDGEAVASAVEAWSRVSFDPTRVVTTFRDAPEQVRSEARASLARLADLDALLRDACRRGMADTAEAIERLRVLRRQLQALEGVEDHGERVDCLH